MLVSNFFLIFTRFLSFNQDTTCLFQISFKVRNLQYTWCFKLEILPTKCGFISVLSPLILIFPSLIIHTCPLKLLWRLSHKVCRLLSSHVLLHKFTNIWGQMTPSFRGVNWVRPLRRGHVIGWEPNMKCSLSSWLRHFSNACRRISHGALRISICFWT